MPRPRRTRQDTVHQLLDMLGNEFEVLMKQCHELRSERNGQTCSMKGRTHVSLETVSSQKQFCQGVQERGAFSLPFQSASSLPSASSLFVHGGSSLASAPCADGMDESSTPTLLVSVAPTSTASLPVSGGIVAGDQQCTTKTVSFADDQTSISSKSNQKNTDHVSHYSCTSHQSQGEDEVPEHNEATQSSACRVERALDHAVEAHSKNVHLACKRHDEVTCSMSLILDTISSVVIMLNMVFLGVNANKISSATAVEAMEIIFVCFFVLERLAILIVSGLREYFVGPDRNWNWFETLLAVGSVFELFLVRMSGSDGQQIASPFLRVVRLARVFKIIRILRVGIFRELMEMVQGVFGGGRTLFWSLVLISVPLYVLAIVLVEAVRHDDDYAYGESATENFATVQLAFFHLFRCTVVGDCSDAGGRPIFVLLAASHGWIFGVVYVMMIMVTHVGLLNVIVAMYVEKTTSASKQNDLVVKQRRLQDSAFFEEKTQELLEIVFDMVGSRGSTQDTSFLSTKVSADDFDELCKSKRFREILCELDVAAEDQEDLFDTLDVDVGGWLDAEELIMGISKLRGDPRRADVISVSLSLRSLQVSFQHFVTDVRSFMKSHELSDAKRHAGPGPDSGSIG
eukprot:TRINITY_DN19254_c0_g5_i1.p1 TRINITY_DN19254_c0_g5~~TRINITY_DN19254_c0_g5_i1.p1  ORF type:complete len:628 (-),score=74.83 TRINITY_DN19254_c0_g5_i1:49-1932(-)